VHFPIWSLLTIQINQQIPVGYESKMVNLHPA